MTFNEINATMASRRPWHQAGLIYGPEENQWQTAVQASHHMFLASALAVTAGHRINPGIPDWVYASLSADLCGYLRAGRSDCAP